MPDLDKILKSITQTNPTEDIDSLFDAHLKKKELPVVTEDQLNDWNDENEKQLRSLGDQINAVNQYDVDIKRVNRTGIIPVKPEIDYETTKKQFGELSKKRDAFYQKQMEPIITTLDKSLEELKIKKAKYDTGDISGAPIDPRMEGLIEYNVPEYRKIKDQIKAVRIAQDYASKIKDLASVSSDSYMQSLLKGFKNNDWVDLATFGAKTIGQGFDLVGIAKRMSEGKAVSDEEKAAYSLYNQFQSFEQYKDKPVTYDIAQSFIQSLPYMAQFAISGNALSGVKAAVTKGLEKKLLSTVTKEGLKKAIGLGIEGGVATLEAAAQTAITPMQVVNTVQRQLDNYVPNVDFAGNLRVKKAEDFEGLGESAVKGWTSAFLGNLSEKMGDLHTLFIPKKLGKFISGNKNVIINNFSKTANAIQKATGIQGTVGETLEEYYNKFLETLVLDPRTSEQKRLQSEGKDKWSDFFNSREALTIIGSTLITQGMFKAAQLPNYMAINSQRTIVNDLSKKVPEQYRQGLLDAMKAEDMEDRVDALKALNLVEVKDPIERATILDYIKEKTYYDILKGAKIGEAEQNILNESLDNIAKASHVDGNLVTVNLDEQPHTVLEGDYNNPDAILVLLDAEGNKKMIKSSQVKPVSNIKADEAVMIAQQDAEMQSKQEENDLNNQELIEQGITPPQIGDNVKVNDETYNVVNFENGMVNVNVLDKDNQVIGNQSIPIDDWTSLTGNNSTQANEDLTNQNNNEVNSNELTPNANSEQLTNQETEIPRDKEGNPDYDSMEPEVFAKEFSKEFGEEETISELNAMKLAVNDKITKLTTKAAKSTSVNERANIKRETLKLKNQLTAIDNSLNQFTNGKDLQGQSVSTENQNTQSVTTQEVYSEGQNQKESTGGVNETNQDTISAETNIPAETSVDQNSQATGEEKIADIERKKLEVSLSKKIGFPITIVSNPQFEGHIDYSIRNEQGEEVARFYGEWTKKGIKVIGVGVSENFRKNGIGKNLYRALNEQAGERSGVLYSDGTFSFTGIKDDQGRNIQPALKLWESLIKTNEASKTKGVISFNYEMKPAKYDAELNKLTNEQNVQEQTESVQEGNTPEVPEGGVNSKEGETPEVQTQVKVAVSGVGMGIPDGSTGVIVKTNEDKTRSKVEFDSGEIAWVDNEFISSPEITNVVENLVSDAEKAIEVRQEENKVDPNPTEAQEEAGNHKMAHIKVQGFDITISKPKGFVRKGTDKNGNKWETTLNNSYGYIRRTKGNDGEPIDVFLGTNLKSGKIYVVDQINPETKKFDEHKVMMGFNTLAEAREAYNSNYQKGWEGLGAIKEMSHKDFKEWIKKDTKKPLLYKGGTNTVPNPFAWLPKEAVALLKSEPNSIPKAIIHFILNGGKFSRKNFIYHTGFGEDSKEVNKASFNGLINGKSQAEGIKYDDFLGTLKNDFGWTNKGNGMELVNTITDILKLETRQNVARRLIELADTNRDQEQQNGEGDYLQRKAEEAQLIKEQEEALYNEAISNIYENYPAITAQEYAELFNFGNNIQDNGNQEGNQGRGDNQNQEIGNGIVAENGQDGAGDSSGIGLDSTAESQEQSYQERLSSLTPTQKAEVESKVKTLDVKIKKGITSVRNAITEYNKEKNAIEKQRVSQGNLFEEAKKQNSVAQLFETPKDFSQKNMLDVLTPKKQAIDKQNSDLMDLYNQRDKIVSDVIEAAKAQQELVIPADQPTSVEPVKNPEVNTPVSELNKLEQEVWDVILSKGQGLIVKSEKEAKQDYPNLFKDELVWVDTWGGSTTVRLTDKGQALVDASKPQEQPNQDKTIQEQIDDAKRNISNLEHRLTQKNQPTQEKAFRESLVKEKELLKKLESELNQPKFVGDLFNDKNPIEDFGDKIGNARKDQDITRKAREKDSLPAWRRKYDFTVPGKMVIGEKIDTSKPFAVHWFEKSWGGDVEKFITAVENNRITRDPKIFTSEQEAEDYIPVFEVVKQGFRIYDKKGKFIIVKTSSTGKILEFDEFSTKEEAQVYLNSAEGAKSLLNRKREDFSIPALEKVERTGKDWRKGKDISTDEFMNTFGFRGGEWGNWVKQEERRVLLNTAYDSLMDLAELLNIPPKAISLSGNLSIAFGARGAGGFNAGKAHYESDRAVINLTRLNGAGSLAHEWAHAMDNYFGLQGAKKTYERNDKGEVKAGRVYKSESGGVYVSGMRKELSDIFEKIVNYTQSKPVTQQMSVEQKQSDYDKLKNRSQEEGQSLIRKFEKGTQRYVYNRKLKQRETQLIKASPEQLEEVKNLVDKLVSGNSTQPKWKPVGSSMLGDYAFLNDDLKRLSELHKEIFGSTGLKRDGNGFYNLGYFSNKLYQAIDLLEKAKTGESETLNVPTEYLKSSKEFDKTRVEPYWQKKVEMFARSFEEFINEKLSGERSDYLQYEKSPIYKALFKQTPYPDGEERAELNKMFDEFFKELKSKEENNHVVMFSKKSSVNTQNFKNWFKESKVVDKNGNPLVVYHGTGTTINEFKPEFTGKGMDQLGSGFYFTTDNDEAHAYQTAINSLGTEKPGGTNNPNIIEAYLSIQNPIKVKGSNLNHTDIDLTQKQAIEIIKKSPILYDQENSPVGNWFDIWSDGIKPFMINEIAKEYTGPSLMSLEGDFFKGYESEFRKAIYDVLGYDGVEIEFGNKKHFVAWFPGQIKSSTTNLGTYDENNPNIFFSKKATFYSNTLGAIDKIAQEKATPEQWKAMLLNNGAKQNELNWMGWDQFVEGKESLTKNDLTEFVKSNQVQIEEVVKSKDKLTDEQKQRLDWLNKNYDSLNAEEMSEWDKLDSMANDYTKNDTKYQQYTTQGGTNYKEWLLTLPKVKSSKYSDEEIFQKAKDEGFERTETDNGILIKKDGEVWDEVKDNKQYLEILRNRYNDVSIKNDAIGFKSSHFDEPNILVHTRTSEFTDKNGKRVLHIDEIQSDWAQKGKKEGFNSVDDEDLSRQIKELSNKTDELADKIKEAENKIKYSFRVEESDIVSVERDTMIAKIKFNTGATIMFNTSIASESPLTEAQIKKIATEKYNEKVTPLDNFKIGETKHTYFIEGNEGFYVGKGVVSSVNEAEKYLNRLVNNKVINEATNQRMSLLDKKNTLEAKQKNKIPDMPFKKTDEWTLLAFKRMLRYAAENGFDGISWTTGEQQAERYDLSKQVDEISYNKETKQLIIWDKNGNTLPPKYTEESELETVIGKEVSQKIIDSKEKTVILSGLDLKVGGEGMKAFYDQIVPSTINKYIKKWGSKTTTNELDQNPEVIENGINTSTGNIGEDKKYLTVHYVPITDHMANSVLTGQPMFSVGEAIEKERKNAAVKQVIEDLNSIVKSEYKAVVFSTEEEAVNHMIQTGAANSEINSVKQAEKGSVEGFFLDSTNTIYIISGNVNNPQDARRVWLHEVASHAGIRALIPDPRTRAAFLSKLFDSIGEEEFKRVCEEHDLDYEYYKTRPNHEKADEYLAMIADKVITEKDLTKKEKGVWDYFIQWVNSFITKLLRLRDGSINFTQRELAYIVKASFNAVKEEEVYDAASEGNISEQQTGQDATSIRDRVRTTNSRSRNNSASEVRMVAKDDTGSYRYGYKRIKNDSETASKLTLFHGTHSLFPRFNIEYVGKGTGEKIHGYALYLTSSVNVGKYYANKVMYLTPKTQDLINSIKVNAGEKAYKEFMKALYDTRGHSNKENVLEKLRSKQEKQTQENNKEAFSKLIDVVDNAEWPNDKVLYRVAVQKSDGTLLNLIDLDAPFNVKEDWESIENALVKEGFNVNEFIEEVGKQAVVYDVDTKEESYKYPNGLDVYKAVSKVVGGDDIATEFLWRAGFDGNIYKDKEVDGGDNLALFSDDNVNIEESVLFSKKKVDLVGDLFADQEEQAKTLEALKKTHLGLYGKIREAFQDSLLTVKKLQNEIIKLGGTVDDFSDIYMTENLSANKAHAKVETYRKNVLQPFINSFVELANQGKGIDEIIKYMMAKHTPERNKSGYLKDKINAINRNKSLTYEEKQEKIKDLENIEIPEDAKYAGPMSTKEANDLVDAFENGVDPQIIDNFWEQVAKMNAFTLDNWYEYGFLSKENYDGIKNNGWKFYIPLRDFKTDVDSIYDYAENQNTNSGYSRPVLKFRGRKSEAGNPIAQMMAMAQSAIASGEKNRIRQAAFTLAAKNNNLGNLLGTKKYWTVQIGIDSNGDPIYEDVFEKPDQIVFDEGRVVPKANIKHIFNRVRAKSQQHEVEAFIDGQKRIAVFTDPKVANSINGVMNEMIQKFTDFSRQYPGGLTRWIAQNLTSKSLYFIPINMIRDLQFAAMYHTIDSHGSLPKFVSNLNKSRSGLVRHQGKKFNPVTGEELKKYNLSNEKDRNKFIDKYGKERYTDTMTQLFLDNGGRTGYMYINDIKSVEKEIMNDIKSLQKSSQNVARRFLMEKIWNSWGKITDRISERSENISRLATFITSVENGKTYKRAAFDAQNVTVNFRKHGYLSGAINPFIMFFNASIQGIQTGFRLGYENKYKFMGVAAGFFSLGLMMAAANGGDDDYWDNNEFLRYNYLMYKIGDKYISIPLPHFFRGFYALGQMYYDVTHGKISNKRYARNMVNNILGNTSPIDPSSMFDRKGEPTIRPLVPSVAIPMYDIAVNEDFSSRPVYREPFTKALQERMASSSQYLKSVNPVIRTATDKLYELGGGDLKTREKFVHKPGEIVPVPYLSDWNPSKIEHLLASYTGGRGKFWLDVVNSSASLINSVKESLTSDKDMTDGLKSMDVNQLPVVSKLLREPYKSRYEEPYQKLRAEFGNYEFMLSNAQKIRDKEKRNDLRMDSKLRSKVRIIERAERQLDTKYYDFINRKRDVLTPKDIEELYDQADEIKKQAVLEIEKL